MALNVPFTIWLIDGFFRQVPRDLAEAAQIDGCTRWQAFWQVEFPLAGPGIALSLPLFFVYARLGIIDTHFGLILAYVALNVPFTIWLIDGFFRQVPKDLAEAAQIDGCTRWQAFWQVEFPLAGPGIASAGIFAFLTSWNEFALASQLTRSVNSKTLPVGLLDYTAEFTIDWRGMCALAVVMIVPALILTFIVQKHLVSGLTSGAVKG